MAYKMKGYTYPGISPLRDGKDKGGAIRPDKAIKADKLSDKELIARADKQFGEGVQIKGKKKAKIDWGKIGTDAISSIVRTGAQAGIEALINPRKRTPRGTTPANMGSIQYGGGTNLLKTK
jgi:hypothetical protein